MFIVHLWNPGSVAGHYFTAFILRGKRANSWHCDLYLKYCNAGVTDNKGGHPEKINTHTYTSWEEGTDHKAEVDGGYGEGKQEDENQRGITVGQHSSIGAHLKESLYRVRTCWPGSNLYSRIVHK